MNEPVAMVTDGSIRTFNGVTFFPLNPDPSLIRIEDIAHGLAFQCRFNGHVRKFYSVAEHSVMVFLEVKKQTDDHDTLLWALLHDASEAYMVDIPKPIKERIPGIVEIEDRITRAIAQRFGLPPEIPEIVKRHDKLLCSEEKLGLRDNGKCSTQFHCHTPDLAKAIFLRRFEALKKPNEN